MSKNPMSIEAKKNSIKLPSVKAYIERNKLKEIELWVDTKTYVEHGYGTASSFEAYCYTKKEHTRVNKRTGRRELNIAEAYEAKDPIQKRAFVTTVMADSIYFELDRYFNDSDKARLLSALTNRSKASWNMYLHTHRFILTTKSTMLLEFIKYGKLILCTKAIHKIKKRYTEPLLFGDLK